MKTIREIMINKVKLVHPDAKLNQAAEEMKNFNIGIIPVVDGDHVIGMLSDRDIVVRAVAEGKDVKQVAVREVMSKEIQTVYEDQSVDELATLMKDKQVRRVVVLDHSEHIAGIVSLGDLAGQQDARFTADILNEVSSPPHDKSK